MWMVPDTWYSLSGGILRNYVELLYRVFQVLFQMAKDLCYVKLVLF